MTSSTERAYRRARGIGLQVCPGWRLLTSACLILSASVRPLTAQNTPPLRLERTIALPGVKGRIDHLTLDASGKRLWLAALGNNSVEVIDLEAGKRLLSIDGPKEPQGVCLIPDLDRVVVASGEDGAVRFYDHDMKVVASMTGLEDADNVRYDPQEKRLYVGYGKGALAVIDEEKAAKLSEIPLAGHPESFQFEQKGRRIFVNVPSAKHIAVIDRDQGAVVARWPVTAAQANFPMALDEPHGRLFIACRKPARLLVLDTKSGTLVANLECCGDVDDVFYDPARRRVYVSGGEGYVSTFEQTDEDHYKELPRVNTSAGARTALFVPATGLLYVAAPQRSEAEAELRIYLTAP